MAVTTARPCRLCGQPVAPDLATACDDCVTTQEPEMLNGRELLDALRRAGDDALRHGTLLRQLHHWWLPRPPRPPKRARKKKETR